MSPSGYPGVSLKNSDVLPAISNMNERRAFIRGDRGGSLCWRKW